MEPAIFFQYEKISDTLAYLGNGVNLKFSIDLGFKNKADGGKRFQYGEYRYQSNKYTNISNLITVKRRFKPYLSIEYPGVNGSTENVYIPPSAILGMREKFNKFDKYITKAFRLDNNNKLVLIQDKIVSSKSTPYPGNEIEIHQDMYYPPQDNRSVKEHSEIGVRMILNRSYSFTMSITMWKEFLYYIMTCDMYGWGTASADSLYSKMIGNFISEMDDYGNFVQLNQPDCDVTIRGSKPISREEKINDFFK